MNKVEGQKGNWASFSKRLLPAIIAIGILYVSLHFGGYIYISVLLAVACFGMHEMYAALKTLPELKPMRYPGYVFIALMVPAWYRYKELGIFILFFICLVLVFATRIFSKKHRTRDAVYSSFALIYPALLFAFLVMIAYLDPRRFVSPIEERTASSLTMIITFGAAIFTDTFAYLTGILIGKHKLCPHISPKKTIEGAIGGFAGSLIGMMVIYFFLQKPLGFEYPVYHFIILGLLASAASQIGDLSASLIKRFTGIKDFGRIMPGHGGVMDRMDSILFVAPVVYAYVTLVLRLGVNG